MIVKKEIDYAKETGEVLVLVKKVVKHFKEGGDIAGATALLPDLMTAVQGVDQIDDEAAANLEAVIATASYHVGEIVGVLIKKKPVEGDADTQASS